MAIHRIERIGHLRERMGRQAADQKQQTADFWNSRKMRIGGSVIKNVPAASAPVRATTPGPPASVWIASGSVFIDSLVVNTSAEKKSFQFPMKEKIINVAQAGLLTAIITLQKIFQSDAPSICAASIRASGIWSKNCFMRKMLKATAIFGRINAQYVGIWVTCGENIRADKITEKMKPAPGGLNLDNTYAPRQHTTKLESTTATETNKLLKMYREKGTTELSVAVSRSKKLRRVGFCTKNLGG
ncbi:hypothetical protein BGX30_015029 [Mortierella sp. GBA39]|nr:hypothetical protein BGX30_015029 [Mortierella sp. GBA39]